MLYKRRLNSPFLIFLRCYKKINSVSNAVSNLFHHYSARIINFFFTNSNTEKLYCAFSITYMNTYFILNTFFHNCIMETEKNIIDCATIERTCRVDYSKSAVVRHELNMLATSRRHFFLNIL